MMAGGFFSLILALFVLFGDVNSTDNPSSSACHCRPVRNIALGGGGEGWNQCDLCAKNKQLLQELKGLEKELETIKNRLSATLPVK